jgi:hypothetical protein
MEPGEAADTSRGAVARYTKKEQLKEVAVFMILALIEYSNSENLKAAVHENPSLKASQSVLADVVRLTSQDLHPILLIATAIWIALTITAIARQRIMPRWMLDAMGVWAVGRMTLDFILINGLIFHPGLVQPSVLLSQILIYLPFFAITWGWLFYRLDRVQSGKAASIITMSHVGPTRTPQTYDYYHATFNAIINKGGAKITGMNRTGLIATLSFDTMLLCLYALMITRLFQLIKPPI